MQMKLKCHLVILLCLISGIGNLGHSQSLCDHGNNFKHLHTEHIQRNRKGMLYYCIIRLDAIKREKRK